MLSSGLEDREKERLLKFFLTKGKLWYNEPENLVTLCKECHKEVHKEINIK